MQYQEILNYLIDHKDFIRETVTALGTPGGIWFLIDKYRGRLRVRLRNVDLALLEREPRKITFEIENISAAVNSFEPTLRLVGYHSDRGRIWKKFEYAFAVESPDRQLAPHVAKQIVATHCERDKPGINFLWCMTLTVTLARGRKVRVHIRNAEFKTVKPLRFQWERFVLLVFHKLP